MDPVCEKKGKRSTIKKDRIMSTMECLPREIVLDILSRLPVISLLQCKFVCRAWRNFAGDPFLVNMHFSWLAEKDPCLILHCDHPVRNQLYSVDFSTQNEENETVKKLHVATMPEFKVVGSCNGLLCLCDVLDSSLYIYNPFTRDYLELPKSTQYSCQDVVLGFGFDPTTRKYKVVYIVSKRNIKYRGYRGYHSYRPRHRTFTHAEVQSYTLGSPTWRSLENIYYNFLPWLSQVLLNGRLHWVAKRRDCFRRMLVSFDLADEKFRDVPKPDWGSLDSHHYYLVVLGGCLSAVVYTSYEQFEIWVMKQYDVKESWIKEFSIGKYVPKGLEQNVDKSFKVSKFYIRRSFVRVLCLLRNGEILLQYDCRGLVSYNPKHGTFKDLKFQGIPSLFHAIVHLGSLNWIDTLIDL